MDEQRVKEALISLLSVGDIIKIYRFYHRAYMTYMITEINNNIIHVGNFSYVNKSDIEYMDGELYVFINNIQKIIT